MSVTIRLPHVEIMMTVIKHTWSLQRLTIQHMYRLTRIPTMVLLYARPTKRLRISRIMVRIVRPTRNILQRAFLACGINTAGLFAVTRRMITRTRLQRLTIKLRLLVVTMTVNMIRQWHRPRNAARIPRNAGGALILVRVIHHLIPPAAVKRNV